MDDLITDFLTETNESLAELDVALVRLEQNPEDDEILSLIFRLVHTIKGTCGFLGLARLERVAHAGENVLGRVRDKTLSITPARISLVLAALDRIKLIVSGLAVGGTEPAGDDGPLIEALNRLAEEGGNDGPELAPFPDGAGPERGAPEPEAPQGPEAAQKGVVEPASAPVSADNVGAQTIRVGVEVLENLMTLVSELVLTRNQLLQLSRAQENVAFSVPLQRLSHITTDLQEGVMKTRMQPIGTAWNKLPRLVRDLSRELDKKIDLVMHGAETELDRQVLEFIKDPLTHMVRNSGDHGLEPPAQRRAAGKPETGRISLNAYHEGGHIIIEIADDGRGLDVDKIKAKVLSRGLASEAELAVMPDEQVQRFIFTAGFSTAAEVTSVSGRGVGMDVVKTNIEKIGGTIDLKSVPGRGTSFTIKIPLTLAIVSALIVESSGERFAIPQISVVELVRASTKARRDAGDVAKTVIETINDTPVLRLRDRLLPLVNLTDLLQLGAPSSSGEQDAHIVVASAGAATLGIIVDRVFDTEEIVVKPVAPILRNIAMFSGNTILGDGSVIMILDPNGIARACGIGAGETKAAVTPVCDTTTSEEHAAMLIFRAGGAEPMAVPLGLVARLEEIAKSKIESSSGNPVTQYRGSLMPLVALSGSMVDGDNQPVLVFTDRNHAMGLMVDEIVDVVQDRMNIELSGGRPGILGTAVIAGRATDIIDTSYWLTQVSQDWFRESSRHAVKSGNRVLVVEDSSFFRQMLVPTLSAAGYQVTAVEGGARALALRDAGADFDVIISDIEMPEMDGFTFAQRVRERGPGNSWAELPLIALAGRATAKDVEAGRRAGFTDYCAKFERDALLTSLRQCLSHRAFA